MQPDKFAYMPFLQLIDLLHIVYTCCTSYIVNIRIYDYNDQKFWLIQQTVV